MYSDRAAGNRVNSKAIVASKTPGSSQESAPEVCRDQHFKRLFKVRPQKKYTPEESCKSADTGFPEESFPLHPYRTAALSEKTAAG